MESKSPSILSVLLFIKPFSDIFLKENVSICNRMSRMVCSCTKATIHKVIKMSLEQEKKISVKGRVHQHEQSENSVFSYIAELNVDQGIAAALCCCSSSNITKHSSPRVAAV